MTLVPFFGLMALAMTDKISSIVKISSNLTKLDLSYSGILDAEGYKLFSMLRDKKNNKLVEVNYDKNWAGKDTCKGLVEFLKVNTSLKTLSLKNNWLEKDAAELLKEAFQTNTTLKHLYLSDSGIKDIDWDGTPVELSGDDSSCVVM